MGRYLGKAISKRCGLQLLRVFVFLVFCDAAVDLL